MPTFTIRKSLGKVIIMSLLALIMTAASFWAALEGSPKVQIAGWIGVVLFGAATLLFPILYIKKRELLVLENAGFRDYSSVSSIGGWGLAWEQVAQIRPGKQGKEIYVDLFNADLYFAEKPLRTRIFGTINQKMGICDIAITLRLGKMPDDMSRGDVIRTMYEYRNHRMSELGFKEF